ncbi:MAG TPA: c-type cytochrome [Terriglobia bacterium]|nr:c-type cytochrome [Terriglobia bacterium]
MKKLMIWLGVCLLFVTVGILWGQEAKQPKDKPAGADQTAGAPAAQIPHTYNITAEQAAKKNPVRFTDFSVGNGKKIFSTQCAMCHGKDADGRGDPDFLAEIKAAPPDLTKPETLKKRTDGELFAIITTGSETMPGQTDRMQVNHKWDVINYLRAVAGKVPDKATEEERQSGTTTVPPAAAH